MTAVLAVAVAILHSSLAEDNLGAPASVRKIRRRKVMMPPHSPSSSSSSQMDPSVFAAAAAASSEQPRSGKHIKVRRRKHHPASPKRKPQSPSRPLEDEIIDEIPRPSSATANDLPPPPPLPVKRKVMRMRKKKIGAPPKDTANHLNSQPPPPSPEPVAAHKVEEASALNNGVVEESPKNRTADEKRFLSLFTIVSFKNDPCTSGTGNNGTCYSSSDCNRLGGTASGSCASGFGVCCLFTKTCGESTSNNCTYFQNSGYPSTYSSVGSCQLTVNKCSSNVCQLRLDFDNMVLAQPESTDHQCQDDQFIVSGGSPIPAICGTNTGIHMYVDMGFNNNSPVMLTTVTSGATFSRSFSVKVTQILCTSLNRASDGCLQYFTGVSGQILSFNYNGASGLQLSNTDYSACIRMERNFCGIQYNACSDNVNTPAMSFSITGGAIQQGSMVGTQCTTDWITIPCATNTNDPEMQTGSPSVCVDRICGMVFNSATTIAGSPSVAVMSFMKPFNIYVHTNNVETTTDTDTGNTGFCFDFIQQPCTSSTGK